MGGNDYTGLLYANPSPFEGFARVMDIGATFDDYNYADGPDDADLIAAGSDWYAVGADLYRAVRRYASRAGVPLRHDQRTPTRPR